MRKLFLLIFPLLALGCGAQEEDLSPQIVAHRGYWKCEDSAQNSISALENAAAIKVWGSEFDVWITADGVPVVNHDPSLHHVLLKDALLADVKDLELDNGEHIPTLDQYLAKAQELPGLQLVLEVKTYHDACVEEYELRAVPAVVEAVKKYGLQDRTTFIAFSLTACEKLAALMPECEVQYLSGDLPPKEVKEHGIDGIDYHYVAFLKHPEWVEEAHSLGMTVNCWTVNSKQLIKKMIELGVDQITTNEPTLTQKLIKAGK